MWFLYGRKSVDKLINENKQIHACQSIFIAPAVVAMWTIIYAAVIGNSHSFRLEVVSSILKLITLDDLSPPACDITKQDESTIALYCMIILCQGKVDIYIYHTRIALLLSKHPTLIQYLKTSISANIYKKRRFGGILQRQNMS